METSIAIADLAELSPKQKDILVAARREFARLGYRAVTVRGIAEKAQVSTRTIYDYFGDKLGLFTACIDAGASNFRPPVMVAGVDPAVALRAHAVAVLRRLTSEGSLQLGLMIFRDAGEFPEINAAAMRNHEQYLLKPLATFLQDLGVAEERSHNLARLFLNMTTSEWQRRIFFGGDQISDAEVLDHADLVTEVFLRGLGDARATDA